MGVITDLMSSLKACDPATIISGGAVPSTMLRVELLCGSFLSGDEASVVWHRSTGG
jgi:hypothetical protein